MSLTRLLVVFIYSTDSWKTLYTLTLSKRQLLPGLSIQNTGSTMTASFDLVFLFSSIYAVVNSRTN